MSDQYRPAYRQSFAWWDVGGADIPNGIFTEFDEKYKAWEARRGFKDENAIEPIRPLKGSALSAKLAFESKKRMLAAEAAKAAKKNLTKKVKATRFAPDIVGMLFKSGNSAQRKIKKYIEKNYLIIPADYEFGVNKIDWGKYEITGSRKQTKK